MSPSPERSDVIACPACAKRNRMSPSAPGVPRCAHCHQALPWLTDTENRNFEELISGSLPVLVDLWAPWCGPRRMVAPAVEDVTRAFAGKLKTVKVNVDQAPHTASRLGVQGVPTLLIIDNGGFPQAAVAHAIARLGDVAA